MIAKVADNHTKILKGLIITVVFIVYLINCDKYNSCQKNSKKIMLLVKNRLWYYSYLKPAHTLYL